MKPGVFAGALGMVGLALPAGAQEEGSAAHGLELAAQLCSACHIVGVEPIGSDVAPPFPAIAKDPDISLRELHGWGGPLHPMLPNLALTPQQVADINAYLDSLREPEAEPGAADEEVPEGASPRIETEKPPPAIEQAPPEQIGPPVTPQQ